MSEETAAASSPAEEADVFNGENVSLADFSKFRETGEVPARFKSTDNAESEPAEEIAEGKEPETEPASEPGKQQEKGKLKHQTADERIAQLEATIDKIKRGAGIERKAEVATVTDKPQPHTRTKPTAEDKKADGTLKYETYEDFVEDLADWKAEQRQSAWERNQQQQAQQRDLQAKVAEGEAIYGEDFGAIADQAAGVIGQDADVPLLVKQRMSRSDILPHLVYTIGSDEEGLANFVKIAKADPFKALDYIAVTENLIREELAKGKETDREENGQFKAATPAKTKTNAPKPPSPVSGASTGAFDVSDESLSPNEWMRKRNADLAKKKG